MAHRVLCLVAVLCLFGLSTALVHSRFASRARSGIGVSTATTKDGTSTTSTTSPTSSLSAADLAALPSPLGDECLPPVTFIIDRTGSMMANKTMIMLDTYDKFLKDVGMTSFTWVRTPDRPSISALTDDTGGAFASAPKPTAKNASSISALRKGIMSVTPKGGKAGDGSGFTDLLTPVKVAAADAKKGPKLVILVTDELNNVYGGVSKGKDYCDEWNQAVKDIESAGGHFMMVFIPLKGRKNGNKNPKAPEEDYDGDPTAWLKYMRPNDKGDLDSFGKCYKEILASPYVVKADKLQDSLNAILKKVTMSVFFTSASDKLNDADKAKIAKKVQCCQGPVSISCHTSKCGDPARNKLLRKSRCVQVQKFHAARIAETDMSFEKNPYKCPQDGPGDGCAEENTQCAQVNRRVDISCSMIRVGSK